MQQENRYIYNKVKTLSLPFLFCILFAGCSNSYLDNIDRNDGYKFRPGYPEVRLVTAGVVEELTDSTKIVLTAEVVYASLVFKKVEDVFRSEVVIDVQIIDLLNPTNIIGIKQYPMVVQESDQRITVSQESFLFEQQYYVEPGEYEINLTVTDLSNNKQTIRTSEAYLPNPMDPVSHITNIRIFSKEETQSEEFKPVTTYDVSNTADSTRFVFQVTNNKADQPLTIDSRLLLFRSDTNPSRPMSWPNYNTSSIEFKGIDYDKYEVVNSSRRVINQPGSVTIEFEFDNLDRGNYRFEVRTNEIEGTELFKARDFSVKSQYYPSLKTAHELAAPLYYLMDQKEYKRLMAIEDEAELKRAIDRFWLKNIKNSKIAQNVISLYYERVEEANKQFSNFKEGWKTDFGMMYILFGQPWYVSRTLDQEVWSYSHNLYDFESNFTFRAPTVNSKAFPFDNYILVRSQEYFSIQYQQIQQWLTGNILRDNL